MERHQGLPTVKARSTAEWRRWLHRHHDRSGSVWLILYKKGSATPSVRVGEAIDEALCFGWVDSLPNKRDAESYYLRFSPRDPKSRWSRVNKEKVERLLTEGRMAPAGLAVVELAKANGTWDALNAVDDLREPDDLAHALDAIPAARMHWDGFPRSVKRGILEWIATAKRETTRTRRIHETVHQAAEGRRANQFPRA